MKFSWTTTLHRYKNEDQDSARDLHAEQRSRKRKTFPPQKDTKLDLNQISVNVGNAPRSRRELESSRAPRLHTGKGDPAGGLHAGNRRVSAIPTTAAKGAGGRRERSVSNESGSGSASEHSERSERDEEKNLSSSEEGSSEESSSGKVSSARKNRAVSNISVHHENRRAGGPDHEKRQKEKKIAAQEDQIKQTANELEKAFRRGAGGVSVHAQQELSARDQLQQQLAGPTIPPARDQHTAPAPAKRTPAVDRTNPAIHPQSLPGGSSNGGAKALNTAGANATTTDSKPPTNQTTALQQLSSSVPGKQATSSADESAAKAPDDQQVTLQHWELFVAKDGSACINIGGEIKEVNMKRLNLWPLNLRHHDVVFKGQPPPKKFLEAVHKARAEYLALEEQSEDPDSAGEEDVRTDCLQLKKIYVI